MTALPRRKGVRLAAAVTAVALLVVGLCTQGHLARSLPRPLVEDERTVAITFADLGGFECAACNDVSAEPREQALPEWVREFGGRRVAIEGFMLPVEYAPSDVSGVTRFLLTRGQMGCTCCFGTVPKANELIEVVMPDDRPAQFENLYSPVVVTGVLDVGMRRVEGAGRLALLYHMRAPDVRAAPEDAR